LPGAAISRVWASLSHWMNSYKASSANLSHEIDRFDRFISGWKSSIVYCMDIRRLQTKVANHFLSVFWRVTFLVLMMDCLIVSKHVLVLQGLKDSCWENCRNRVLLCANLLAWCRHSRHLATTKSHWCDSYKAIRYFIYLKIDRFDQFISGWKSSIVYYGRCTRLQSKGNQTTFYPVLKSNLSCAYMMDCLIVSSMYGSLTRCKRFLLRKLSKSILIAIYLPGAAHSRHFGHPRVALSQFL
jgi:hypothetical protein